jgi:5-hydroxyisourate hydrolase-like protein (transthyretin family)
MIITSRVLLLLSLVFVCSALCLAQTPAKEATASVTGHVTIRGKPAPGITIVATLRNSFFDNKTVAKTTTDEDGNYKLIGLPAGQFTILPLNRAYVVASGSSYKEASQSVNVAEGEAITKIDFVLVRGGVVTGRITDAEGHPLIGERVNIALKDSSPDPGSQFSFGSNRYQTDDRGIYRNYGLGPGNYRVSVGQASAAGGAASVMGIGGSQYVKTFYPSVEDESRATIIEIKEGTEIANVDITVNKPGKGFSVSGRVIDVDSGAPAASVYVAHSVVDESNQQVGGMNFSGTQTDANGKFRLEGLRPGRYAIYTLPGGAQENSSYSEQATFEVADSDVTGIEIKLRRGATINGVAIIENNSDPAAAALLQSASLYAYVEQKSSSYSYAQSRIAADGSFRMTGLAPGKAQLGIQGFNPPKGLSLVRTEVDGLEQKEGIEIAAGAQINGLRLVFAYGTGSIRGEVKVEGGSLPEGITLQVLLRSAENESRRFNRGVELDSRLHFIVENIPPGSYEVVVTGVTLSPGVKPTPPVKYLKQPVTIANGTETRLSLVVDLSAKQGSQP